MTEETIFTEALEKSTPIERTAYLDQACAGDTVLRQRIETLLKSHEADGNFLGKPAIQCAAEAFAGQACAADTQGELPADDGGVEALDFLAPSDKPGVLGRLGHYEVLEVIGRGGMGIVLRAFDEKLHRVVAIKVMAAQLATNATARKRFSREAQAAAAVTHDHIVTIHAVEDATGLPYLVMQYVSGMSLQQRLDRSGPLELREIVRIGMQMAAGLAAAHAQGLIHRDIKPANILLENGVERVKITDFGLARAVADASLTQSGVVAGTPQYMSPEQARGDAVDQRADLFSLGSVLYAMCAGRPPFRATTGIAVLKRVCEDTPSPIREINAEIPAWLAEIVTKLHAKDPAGRFQSAAEVAELLNRHLAHLQHPSVIGPVAGNGASPSGNGPGVAIAAGQPARRHRRWAMAAAVLLVCAAAGLGFTEATGVTSLRATVIRIFTPDGTLIVEVDDPGVKVTIEGDGGLVITGAGLEEIRLRPGSYKVHADRDGKKVLLERELVSITKGGREVVRVKLEAAPAAASAADLLKDAVLLMNFEKDTFYQKDGKTYVRDLSGNANDGLCDKVEFTPDGKSGGGLACKGGRLQLKKSYINRQPNYTITFWGRSDKLGVNAGKERLYGSADHDRGAFVFGIVQTPQGAVQVDAWNLATQRDKWFRANAQQGLIPQGEWYFLAVSLSGGGVEKGELRVTVNDTVVRLPSQMVDSSWDGLIDVLGHEMTDFVLDEVAIFQRALSDREIAGIRTLGLKGIPLGAGNLPTPHLVPRAVLEGHTSWVRSLAFSPDGKTLATGCNDQGVRLWDAKTGDLTGQFHADDSSINSLAYSPDGTVLVSASTQVRVWDAATCKLLAEAKHGSLVSAVAFRRGDSMLATASSHDKTLKLWKWDGAVLEPVRTIGEHSSGVWAMSFNPQGTVIAAATRDGMLYLWDVESGKPLKSVRLGLQALCCLAFSPDGMTIAAGGYDKRVELRKADTLESVGTLRGHKEWVWSLVFLPDGKTLVSAGGDHDMTKPQRSDRPGELKLWDVVGFKQRLSVGGHEKGIRCVALSADGKTLATGDYSNLGRLWDVDALLAAARAGETASAGATLERGAFVLLAGKGIAERKFDSLADAVLGASDGDTIEIRGNGPFVSQPIKITRPLNIRAGVGLRPVIQLSPEAVQARANLLQTTAPLTLEGLEFQLVAQLSDERQDPWQSIVLAKGPLYIANCRLLFKQLRGTVVENYGPICELRNCEVICPTGNWIASYHQPHLRMNIDHCCLTTGIITHYGRYEVVDYTKESTVRSTLNTFVTQNQPFCFLAHTDKVPGLWTKDQRLTPVRLATEGNIWDTRTSVLLFGQTPSGKVLPPDESEASLPKLLAWHGARNLYAVDGPFLGLGIIPREHPAPAKPIRSVAEWGAYWGAAEAESIEGRVRYQGGDLLSRLAVAPEKLTAEDFRLRPDSAGYRAGKDGKDLGADVDLVGPGPAYERWKKTPEYQQWLKDTGQKAVAAKVEDDGARTELAKWQGEWRNADYGRLVIRGERWSSHPKNGFEVVSTIKIVEVTDEMTHILLLNAGIDGKVRTIQTILRVDGDTLHNCGTIGSVRPTEFANKPGCIYTQWKRVAKTPP